MLKASMRAYIHVACAYNERKLITILWYAKNLQERIDYFADHSAYSSQLKTSSAASEMPVYKGSCFV